MKIHAIAIAKKGELDFEIIRREDHHSTPKIEVYIKKPGSGDMCGAKEIEGEDDVTIFTKTDDGHDKKISKYGLFFKEYWDNDLAFIIVYS